MNDSCDLLLDLLKKEKYVFSRKLIENVANDIFGGKRIPTSGNKYVEPFRLAQKFVNMTFKLLYVFKDYTGLAIAFSKCDCPLDSIILKSIGWKGPSWSKMTMNEYKECQEKIAYILKPLNLTSEEKCLGNLAYDFRIW